MIQFLSEVQGITQGKDGVKLTKCDKVEWSEKCHYAGDILLMFPWLIFYFIVILFYIDRKLLIMRNLATI